MARQKNSPKLPKAKAAYQKSGGVGLCDDGSTGESTQCNLMNLVKIANESFPNVVGNKTTCVKVIVNGTRIYRGCGPAVVNEMMDKSEGCMKNSTGTVEVMTHWCSSDNCNGICNITANIILMTGLLMGMAIK